MDIFVARSGREVKAGREDGSLVFGKALGYLSREAAFDAEEYFQAKRDAELGRWRYPLEPNIVVYENFLGLAFVFDEDAGDYQSYTRAEAYEIEGLTYRRAARAYFEAHPASKPWHDAQRGQFWRVTHNGMVEVCRVDDVGGLRFVGVQYHTSVSMPITHRSITDAVQMVVAEPSSQAGLQSFRGTL